MEAVAQQAREATRFVEGIYLAFMSATIGTDDYKDKALATQQSLRALARLHPYWSDACNQFSVKKAVPLDDDDPLFFIYLRIEELVTAWRIMRVSRPSGSTLSRGSKHFMTCLQNLKNETEATLDLCEFYRTSERAAQAYSPQRPHF